MLIGCFIGDQCIGNTYKMYYMYIVVLNVLYDDVYMYKSLQIKFLFCSVKVAFLVKVLTQSLRFLLYTHVNKCRTMLDRNAGQVQGARSGSGIQII